MPIELMRTLAESGLPTVVEGTAEIDKLRILVAAELIEAQLPPVTSASQTAEVLDFTAQGRAALRKAYPHLHLPCTPAKV
jgi:hypothetical protein